MATALIFAGGTGTRMNSKSKPKQFLELYGKPIIIHTLEYFERHQEVQDIAVVCLSSWIEELKESIKKFNLKKVRWIVEGGKSGQESIYNGLQAIYNDCEKAEDKIVLIHDGVRPLISEQLITDNIEAVRKFGSAITVGRVKETVVSVDSRSTINEIADRAVARIAKAPQSFYLKDIYKVHKNAIRDGIKEMTDSATLMKYYGSSLHIVECGTENIKITTPTDYYIFRAIYEARENSQIFGFEVKQ
ncbi:2-C-methyl-D-erythritol 4-phosphate cytidylyltransferase [Sporosarcina sp. ACRSM]|uniref:IspD/TarI family cytidylyltransferase n=1 Tax=Sporosarcina sp. ACRSM TaxID=2918216 RepID=UPI001EF570F9|nr:IspD/TarI family cytidylyltransferase [Sporosarcina sp. ACRSM]MCG7334340.1 2-C-methyl-D-erythritol 4-phosphate cytidylyltransferase [Sporosarcina sp. ACRSM]